MVFTIYYSNVRIKKNMTKDKEMNEDRFFFEPYGLALGKGFAYLLAYATAIWFSNAEDSVYFYNIMLFCCGCVCEYFELGFCNPKKVKWIRNTSRIIAVLTSALAIITFSIAYNDTPVDNMLVGVFEEQRVWLEIFLAVLWFLPLCSGFVLMLLEPKGGEEQEVQRMVSFGNQARP